MDINNRGKNMGCKEKFGLGCIQAISVFGLVLFFLFGVIYFVFHIAHTEVISLFGLSVLIIFVLTYYLKNILIREKILKSESEFLGIICESDGYPSLSRTQFLIWTFVIGTVFLWILLLKMLYVYQNSKGIDTSTLTMPDNLLWLMGISSFTAVASKGLSSFKYKGTKKKPHESRNLLTMFMEDGKLSLTRYQMFLWTVISVLAYFGLTLGNIFNNYTSLGDLNLPDCPQVLLALMGISQATYLGGKFTFQPPDVSISKITPNKGKIGNEVTIYGFNFGDKDKMGSVIFCETTIPEEKITEWKNTRIRLTIPSDVEPGENGVCEVKVVSESGIMTLPYGYEIDAGDSNAGNPSNKNPGD